MSWYRKDNLVIPIPSPIDEGVEKSLTSGHGKSTDSTTSSHVHEKSTDSTAHKHFHSLTTALQDEFEELKRKEETVEKEAVALKKEKEQMQRLVDDEDIIYLNIGGDTMSCSRSTLCQVEESLLASMFSGRWEDGLKKDKHGNIFLDFNPICFKVILNYLRAKRIETPERKATKPKPPVNEEDNFWNLASYLGLVDELQIIKVVKKPVDSWGSLPTNPERKQMR